MPETFDAYHKWLGIPPAEQPPNYYRLLAIPLFESDADVIANAADKQMAHIRSFQTGQHSALSQKILNEIAAARVCLLNAAKKPAYDAVLRRETGGMLPKAASIGAQPAPGFDLESIASPAIARRPQPPRRKKVSWQPLAAFGASVVLLVVIVVFATTRDGRDKAAGPKTSAQLVVKKTPEAAKPTEKPKEKPAKPEPEPEPKQIAPSKSVEPASKPEHIDARPEDKAPAPGPVTEPKPVARPTEIPAAESPEKAESRLKQALADAKTPEEYRTVAQDSLKVFEQAASGGQTDLAKRMAAMALVAARKAHDDSLAEDAVRCLITGKRAAGQ